MGYDLTVFLQVFRRDKAVLERAIIEVYLPECLVTIILTYDRIQTWQTVEWQDLSGTYGCLDRHYFATSHHEGNMSLKAAEKYWRDISLSLTNQCQDRPRLQDGYTTVGMEVLDQRMQFKLDMGDKEFQLWQRKVETRLPKNLHLIKNQLMQWKGKRDAKEAWMPELIEYWIKCRRYYQKFGPTSKVRIIVGVSW